MLLLILFLHGDLCRKGQIKTVIFIIAVPSVPGAFVAASFLS